MRPATSAPARTATTSTEPAPGAPPTAALDTTATLELLRAAELEPVGWLVGSSNHAMVVRARVGVTATNGAADQLAVWKPTAGERPLFDFPIGTLTRREVASFLVSEALGWGIVPPTILRDGPAGEGMLQAWIEIDPTADVIDMVNEDDPRLRRVAVLDAILNNTDRKAGHLLPVPGGHLFAVDHGVTFSVVPKLRSVLWAWEGELFDEDEAAGLARVADALGTATSPGALAVELAELLAKREIAATRARVAELIAAGVFPSPNPDWPAVPWPPY
jgi:uncharacterized repeat protein (TIGR03843 family)